MLFHYLNQYPKHIHPSRFHHYPDFGTFSSASQVQIDVNYSDLVNTINTFTKLEPIKALLFSNSVMPEEETDLICVRDMLWENSMHGINPKNIGMYEYELASVDDLFEYIKQTSIYCIMRNGKYINFSPIPILQYFSSNQITGEYWNGNDYEKITFQPLLEDLKYHRTFKFLDLTFRGTIEFRSCCQPISDSMTVAAFHTGLTENLELLKHLFDTDTVIYGHGISVTDLRKAFCQNIIPEEIRRDQLQSLCISILDLAKDGLTKRHFDEEHFLDPLYSRVLQRTNPALEYIRFLNSGSNINEIIQQYSKISC